MSTQLEERYRTILRILPADYRAAWEDEMVATFLASMATDDTELAGYRADFGRPSWPEVASVVILAVRLRLGGVSPRHRLWGEAIRRIALMGMLTQAVLAIVGLAFFWMWAADKLPGQVPTDFPRPGRWDALRDFLGFAVVPGYVALVFGHWRAARLFAVLSIGTAWVTVLLRGEPFTWGQWFLLMLNVVVLLALLAFRRDAPRLRPWPWLAALPIGAAAWLGIVLLDAHRAWPLLDLAGLYCIAVVGAALVRLGRRRGRAAWSLALALLAPALLLQRLATLPYYAWEAPPEHHRTLLTLALVEAAATLAVAVPLVLLAARELRRLPATLMKV